MTEEKSVDTLSPEKRVLYSIWEKFVGRARGHFDEGLRHAIINADEENLQRLHKGFPRLIDAYSVFTSGKTIEERYCE